jgi:hypothetical protein
MGFSPKWEFVYGSRTVQLQDNPKSHNVYKEIVDKYNLKFVIPFGEVWYGEIYGEGVQKGYSYGIKGRDVMFFDVMKDGKYLDWETISGENHAFGPCKAVPYWREKFNLESIKRQCTGVSGIDLAPTPEGFVVRPRHERTSHMGRVILKFINPDYLLKDNTEFH